MDLENVYAKIYRYVYFRIKDQTVAEDTSTYACVEPDTLSDSNFCIAKF